MSKVDRRTTHRDSAFRKVAISRGMRVIIDEFKSVRKNTLRGFVSAKMPSGMILRDMAVNTSHGKTWVTPPSIPLISRDGTPVLGKNGKTVWKRLVDFENKELERLFSAAVLDALRVSYPEVFIDEKETA
jgi:hypothetical protein